MNKIKDAGKLAHGALNLASLASAVLFSVKIVMFFFSGSMIVLGSAFDSLSDAFVSFINAKVSIEARESADKDHPFGHGGYEVVGALVQGILILFLGYNLVSESIRKAFGAAAGQPVVTDMLPVASGVLFLSAFAGFAIHMMLDRKHKKIERQNQRSLSVESDIAHYAGDMVVNFLSAIGLLVVWYFEAPMMDPILGILAGLWLFKTAYPILKKSFSDIVHKKASKKVQTQIVELVMKSSPLILGIHQLRSRELGPMLFVDFHLKLPRDLLLEKAHDVGDLVVKNIKDVFPRADVIVHLDPDSEDDHTPWEPAYEMPEV